MVGRVGVHITPHVGPWGRHFESASIGATTTMQACTQKPQVLGAACGQEKEKAT